VATIGGLVFLWVNLTSFAEAQTDFNIPTMTTREPPPPGRGLSEADKRLQEQIVKEDVRRNTEDTEKLLTMVLELKDEIAKSETRFVSAKAAKDAQEIEKLAKNIRGRLNRDVKSIRFAPIGQAQ
jgi:hypothetical protein